MEKSFGDMNTIEMCRYAISNGLGDVRSYRHLKDAASKCANGYRKALSQAWHIEDIPELNEIKEEVLFMERFAAGECTVKINT